MIEVTQLGKSFGELAAVRGIDFTVRPGEVLGFLGPNKAGKSTTMKMITGFIAPTTDSVRVCGCDVHEDTLAARRFGALLVAELARQIERARLLGRDRASDAAGQLLQTVVIDRKSVV